MDEQEKEQAWNRIKTSFMPERARGITAEIQIVMTGEEGGEFFLIIQDQTLALKPGRAEKPRLTLRGSTNDLLGIFHRKLDPAAAYFQGRLEISGDLNLAMSLPGLFK
jgi:putative sterol carrier protein